MPTVRDDLALLATRRLFDIESAMPAMAIVAPASGLVHVLFPGVMQRVSQFAESRSSTG